MPIFRPHPTSPTQKDPRTPPPSEHLRSNPVPYLIHNFDPRRAKPNSILMLSSRSQLRRTKGPNLHTGLSLHLGVLLAYRLYSVRLSVGTRTNHWLQTFQAWTKTISNSTELYSQTRHLLIILRNLQHPVRAICRTVGILVRHKRRRRLHNHVEITTLLPTTPDHPPFNLRLQSRASCLSIKRRTTLPLLLL